MLSKEEVTHIAKLARLELTDAEITSLQKDMSAILEYFNILRKAQKSKVKAQNLSATALLRKGRTLASPKLKTSVNITRKDEAMPANPNIANHLINAAPDKKEGYIKVKAVL